MANSFVERVLKTDGYGPGSEPGAGVRQQAAKPAHRQNKREQILEMFIANLGVAISSAILHSQFGSSFRTRVSELNRDAGCTVAIKNKVTFNNGCEESVYWAEAKAKKTAGLAQLSLFEHGTQ